MDNITIKYDAVLSICDEITKVIRDLNEQIEQVNRITNNNNFWQGMAANKFSTEVRKKYDNVSEMTDKIIPTYLEQIKTIVEYNRKTDGQISATDIISANSIVKITASTALITRIAQITSGVKANTNVSSKTTTSTDAKKSSEIKTDTKANDNVKSNTDNSKKNINQIESDKVKTTTSTSISNNTTSNTGAISLSELLKFIKK